MRNLGTPREWASDLAAGLLVIATVAGLTLLLSAFVH